MLEQQETGESRELECPVRQPLEFDEFPDEITFCGNIMVQRRGWSFKFNEGKLNSSKSKSNFIFFEILVLEKSD